MPATRTYVVSQTREVQVSADSLQNAIIIAGVAFDGVDTPDIIKDIKETDISAREAY